MPNAASYIISLNYRTQHLDLMRAKVAASDNCDYIIRGICHAIRGRYLPCQAADRILFLSHPPPLKKESYRFLIFAVKEKISFSFNRKILWTFSSHRIRLDDSSLKSTYPLDRAPARGQKTALRGSKKRSEYLRASITMGRLGCIIIGSDTMIRRQEDTSGPILLALLVEMRTFTLMYGTTLSIGPIPLA